MKTKITLLNLVLFITAFGWAQQSNLIQQHRLLPNENNDFSFDTEYEQFYIRQLIPSGSNISINRSKNTMNSIQSLDSLVSSTWYPNVNQWKNFTKRKYAYDANGNRTSVIFYSWNSYANPNRWNISRKHAYTYDANGNRVLDIGYYWYTTTSQWIYETKSDYTFDANDNLSLEISYDWNVNQWIYDDKFEYTFDANNNLILKINYDWDTNVNQWKNYNKIEYTYDVNNNKTSEIEHYWYEYTNQWINFNRIEYTYDVNNNLILEIGYAWDVNANQWKNYNKIEYTYDVNNNLTLKIIHAWDVNANQWKNYKKYEYNFDANENRILYVSYDWDDNLNQWIFNQKNENNYDLSINVSDLIVPLWYINAFNPTNKLLDIFSHYWNTTTNSWDNGYKYFFYYSDTSGINELSDNNIKLYPNPVNNDLNINFENNIGPAIFEVFNMQGTKLLTQKVSTKDQIHLNYLHSGVYLYTITIDGKIKSGKIIKK